MSYSCPRCGGPIQRGHSTGAHMAAGLAGGLIYAAFGAFHCRSWGKVPQRSSPLTIKPVWRLTPS